MYRTKLFVFDYLLINRISLRMEILLPEEIVVKIGLYLDAKDVLSSCLVSKFWRNALNINKIWFNLCWKEFWLEKMENPILDVRSCRFYPAFSHPVNDCDQLSDICPWRVRFMQEIRISRNWKSGKFHEQPIRQAEAQELERISKVDMLCGEDFIIAPYQINNSHKFRIWEFKDDIFETVPIVCSHRFENVDFFNLTDCGFIYVQSNLLVYYVKKENCIFSRRMRVLITEEPSASKNIPDDEDITNWYDKNVKQIHGFYSFCNSSKYFVAPISCRTGAKFHIWDIQEGTKRTEFLNPGMNFFDISMRLTLHNSKLLIDFAFQGAGPVNFYPIFRYDLNTKIFTKINMSIPCPVRYPLITEDHTISLDHNAHSVAFWDNKTGAVVSIINYDENFSTNDDDLMLISPSYITVFSSSKGKIRLFNTKLINFDGEIMVNDYLDSIQFIKPDMILVQIDSMYKRDQIFTELWDIKTRQKVQTCYPTCCLINKSRTKMIDIKQHRILHFW